MQLVAYGAQDIYLSGNPSITFFKLVYRRHTSFALEQIEQTFNGTVGYGRRVSSTISRNGDLVTTAYLEITLKRKVANDTASSPYFPAEALIKSIDLEVGGQKIDSHTNTFFRIYDELFRTGSEKLAYKRLTNFADNTVDGKIERLYLPLIFSFNRNPGLALPLISLQYHEVKINVQFESSAVLATLGIDTAVDPQVTLYASYVYLDAEERRRFAQSSHEYLITQVQFTGAESVTPDTVNKKTQNIRLNFNHPTKYLAWVFRQPNIHGKFTTSSLLSETSDAYAPLASAKIALNGTDRFSERKGSWFSQVSSFEAAESYPAAGIYLYSFALKPADHQPSGTCNFSRIDAATLTVTLKAGSMGTNIANVVSEDTTLAAITNLNSLEVYAENYNVFRIQAGMGGLAYSN